jgi:hypothetical protein
VVSANRRHPGALAVLTSHPHKLVNVPLVKPSVKARELRSTVRNGHKDRPTAAAFELTNGTGSMEHAGFQSLHYLVHSPRTCSLGASRISEPCRPQTDRLLTLISYWRWILRNGRGN